MSGPGSNNNASEMNIPSYYDNRDWGAVTKIVKRKVTTRSSGDKSKQYGSKTIMTKEDNTLSFIDYLIEGDDTSAHPQILVDELKKNIRAGAKDLTQKWKNALELIHKAYHVSNVRIPSQTEKGARKQYEDLLTFAVHQLAQARGLMGDWRTTAPIVREAEIIEELERNSDMHIGNKRFFVEIPGERAQEVEGKNMDDIIDAISNKIRNSKHVRGTKVRTEFRDKERCVLTVWVNDVKRERIVIRQYSAT